jgi:hypothetical protein
MSLPKLFKQAGFPEIYGNISAAIFDFLAVFWGFVKVKMYTTKRHLNFHRLWTQFNKNLSFVNILLLRTPIKKFINLNNLL